MQKLAPDTSNRFVNMSFVCAILVVIIHVWQPTRIGSPAWWLYALMSFRNVALPFFFLASGYFLAGHMGEEGWWLRETHKRVYTLLFPYVLWNVLWALFAFAFYGTGLRSFGWTLLGLDLFRHPALAPLWYVRSLLILVAVSPILHWALRRYPRLTLGVAFVKLFFYKGTEIGTWYYLLDHSLSLGFLFYFLFGMALRKGWIPRPKTHHPVLAGLSAVVLWLALYGTYALLGYDLDRLPRLVRLVFLRVDVLHTLCWMYFIWVVMSARPLPRCLAATSFPVYLVHWFVLTGLWQHYVCPVPDSVLDLLQAMAVGIFGTLAIVLALQKFIPRVSRVLFGMRG